MKLLILGASGFLGRNLHTHLSGYYEIIGTCNSHNEPNKLLKVDCASDKSVQNLIKLLNPDVIINCVGYKDVPKCEIDQEYAFELNAHVPHRIGRYASPHTKIIHISTDYVYGSGQHPKNEYTEPTPTTVYGSSKYAGERLLLDAHNNSFIVRTGGLYGNGKGFVQFVFDNISKDTSINAFDNVRNTPTYVGNLAEYIIHAVADDLTGVRNFADRDAVTRYELALAITRLLGKNESLIVAETAPSHMLIPEDLTLTSIYHNAENTGLLDGLRKYLKGRNEISNNSSF